MPTRIVFTRRAELDAGVGREVCVTDWVTVDQARIDAFAEATGDRQWIHVDAERARRESPWGRTIAHGFLTLSLLGQFYEEYLTAALPFCDMGLNYGLNRVRFTSVVPVGSRVRARLALARLDEVEGGVQATFAVTIDLDGADKPACVAESVIRRHYRNPGRASGAAWP